MNYNIRFARLKEFEKNRWLPVKKTDPASAMNALSALKLAARLIGDSFSHRIDVIRYKSNKIEWSHAKNCFPPSELSVLTVDYGSAFSLNLPECGQREKIQRENTIHNLSAEWCFNEILENGEIRRKMQVFHFISRTKNYRGFFNYCESFMRSFISENYEFAKINEEKVLIVLDNCTRKGLEFILILKYSSFSHPLQRSEE